MMGNSTTAIRLGNKVRLSGEHLGIVLRVQSPRRMQRVHGAANHPGLCQVKWGSGPSTSGDADWYEATHLTVVVPAPTNRFTRLCDGLRQALASTFP